jgi:hypothetical protein
MLDVASSCHLASSLAVPPYSGQREVTEATIFMRAPIQGLPDKRHGQQEHSFAFLQNLTNVVSHVPTKHHGDDWEERRYSSYSFTTSALDGGEWSASRPGCVLPPVPTIQEAGWAREPVWTQGLEEKSFCPCRVPNLDRLVRSQTLY